MAGTRAGCDHAVQFYEDEDFVCRSVADFIQEGVRNGEPAIVIARPERKAGVARQLRHRGVDFDGLCAQDRLVFRDAREVLGAVMSGTSPDAARFQHVVERLLDGAGGGGPHAVVRAYGEMVDVLWQDENREAAIRLEELWNGLARGRCFSLLCTYGIGNFDRDEHAEQFRRVCSSHGRVLPAEGYSALPDEQQRGRYVSLLQQRAHTLEVEIERRRELERALVAALSGRRAAEQERERLLAAERAARADAERANGLKDEFLGVLSHELRTPLNAILGWVRLANTAGDEATGRRAWKIVERNAALQLHLVDDLLDISRIISGRMHVASDAVDLTAVVSGAADAVRPAAGGKSIALEVSVGQAPLLVRGDAGRLHQVVWNLLTNAIKFTPERGRVDVRARGVGPDAEIVVSDNGEGIDAQFLPDVFERFRQADTGHARRHGGLGVGLAIVRHLVAAHRGTVTVESAGRGRGTICTVTLPLAA